jgi:hypothetical protein
MRVSLTACTKRTKDGSISSLSSQALRSSWPWLYWWSYRFIDSGPVAPRSQLHNGAGSHSLTILFREKAIGAECQRKADKPQRTIRQQS